MVRCKCWRFPKPHTVRFAVAGEGVVVQRGWFYFQVSHKHFGTYAMVTYNPFKWIGLLREEIMRRNG